LRWREEIEKRFGDRVTFDRVERYLYSRDVGALPSLVEKMISNVPDAVVQPESLEDLVFLVQLSRRHEVPLVPRGAGTSGYGGCVPARRGIVVDFTRLDRVLEVDPSGLRVRVEAGVVWKELEKALADEGLALRLYPTSALGSTVAGWVAEGGAGIGSFEYGTIGDNVLEVELVSPSGEVMKFAGSDLEKVVGLEGTTGLIYSVTLAVRPADQDVPLLAGFPDLAALQRALERVSDSDLPLWHVGFSTAEYVAYQRRASDEEEPGEKECYVLFVFPASRSAVRDQLVETVKDEGGRLLPQEMAEHEWEERFYPMRLKRLGPSLIPSEGLVPVDRLASAVRDIQVEAPGIAIEGHMCGRQEMTLLTFLLDDERTAAYTINFSKSLYVLDAVKRNGGRPYSVGLYLTDEAEAYLGPERLARYREYKAKVDPGNLLNPGKILRQGDAMAAALRMARSMRPIVKLAAAVAGKTPGKSSRLPALIAEEAVTCTRCGYCRNVCTLFSGMKWESASPRGKWNFLRAYDTGKLPLTQEVVDKFLLCTTCKRCDDVCQVQIPIQALWDDMRGFLIQEKEFMTFPAFEMMAASYKGQRNIWGAYSKDRASWVPEDVQYQDEGEIGYWAGCTASFIESDIAANAVRILRDGGIEFAYLGEDEACCGVPFFMAGKWELFEEVVRYNIGQINGRGIKKLVVSCPGCWVALHHFYKTYARKLGLSWDVEIVHITELAAELIKEGKLEFKQDPGFAKLTWHDPCHIGRHGGIYEPPREVLKALPGTEFVEMEHNREDGYCCGSVLTRVGHQEVSNEIVKFRLGEAEDVGAEAIVTTCPCCEFQLRVGAKATGHSVPIVDFANVVARALGYETEDPTENCHYIWGVFEKMLYQMTLPAMVEMMEELMPGMMEKMPEVMQKGMGAMKSLPGGLQDAMLGAMDRMVPLMMPKMMDMMLPKMMPDILKLMEEKIPDMPESMRKMMPEMLPQVMEALMPHMMKAMIPLVKPKMMEVMKEQIRGRAG